jgi:DNA-binding MltR family transcriptional regulator
MHRFSHLTETERRDLFEGTAPLSTAKTKIAYAIGVVGKLTRHDLEKMRELRNAAAHSTRHITFKLPASANIVGSLNSLKDVSGGASYSVQHKFVSCVNQVMTALVGKMHTPPLKVQGIKHLD